MGYIINNKLLPLGQKYFNFASLLCLWHKHLLFRWLVLKEQSAVCVSRQLIYFETAIFILYQIMCIPIKNIFVDPIIDLYGLSVFSLFIHLLHLISWYQFILRSLLIRQLFGIIVRYVSKSTTHFLVFIDFTKIVKLFSFYFFSAFFAFCK